MTFKSKLVHRLDELARRQATDERLELATDRGTLACQLTEIDRIGCKFAWLEFRTDQLAQATPEQLDEICRRLSTQVNYLLEPIAPLETDAERCVAQMRSLPPGRDTNGTSYYELIVERGGKLALRRYLKQPGSPRHPVPAAVTGEVFVRLASNLAGAV